MKWENKGHEYDQAYQEMKKKKGFYLFGAGDYGRQFLGIMDQEVPIIGYIDNDKAKQGQIVNGKPCRPLEGTVLGEDEGIIVTMSQIARIKPVKQLKRGGYKKDIDFFMIEEFLSVYYVYQKGMVYFSSISFLPSTACNLNCRYCLNFNPFAEKFYVRKWEDLVRDVDLFFACVDRIMLFHVSGGEPFLYKHTGDLIEYIHKRYGDRIDTLRMVTNGTIVPPHDVLEKLSTCNVEITVDDYRKAVPQYAEEFSRLIEKLKAYKIRHYVNQVDSWIDLAPERTDYSAMGQEWLIQHRAGCNQSWQELRDGKLYNCNYAAYAAVAGVAGGQDAEEVYCLKGFTPEKKKELVEFRLGYTAKGYTNFCKKCRGFTAENSEEVEPAGQVKDDGA